MSQDAEKEGVAGMERGTMYIDVCAFTIIQCLSDMYNVELDPQDTSIDRFAVPHVIGCISGYIVLDVREVSVSFIVILYLNLYCCAKVHDTCALVLCYVCTSLSLICLPVSSMSVTVSGWRRHVRAGPES